MCISILSKNGKIDKIVLIMYTALAQGEKKIMNKGP